jgi:hypothetical protein
LFLRILQGSKWCLYSWYSLWCQLGQSRHWRMPMRSRFHQLQWCVLSMPSWSFLELSCSEMRLCLWPKLSLQHSSQRLQVS